MPNTAIGCKLFQPYKVTLLLVNRESIYPIAVKVGIAKAVWAKIEMSSTGGQSQEQIKGGYVLVGSSLLG